MLLAASPPPFLVPPSTSVLPVDLLTALLVLPSVPPGCAHWYLNSGKEVDLMQYTKQQKTKLNSSLVNSIQSNQSKSKEVTSNPIKLY